MPRGAEPPRRAGWHSQPVAWLGLFIFALSVAGCLWLIATGVRYDDQPLDVHRRIFGVPTSRSAQPAQPASPLRVPMPPEERSDGGSRALSPGA